MNSKQGNSNELSVADRLQKYTFRSKRQVLIHVLITFMLATVLYFSLQGRVTMTSSAFVAIMSAMSAASGALLAITIAVANFYSVHVIDWRDKLIERLSQAGVAIRAQIEKSAPLHPDISRHLAALYDKAIRYIPGQTVDMTEVEKAASVFFDWANEQATRHARAIDLGNPDEYKSFQLHLRDAVLRCSEVKHVFRLLGVAGNDVRAIGTFEPLIIGWVSVLVFTLSFAIIGGMGGLSGQLAFPVLIIPLWLFLVAIFALLKDIMAVLTNLRIQEISYDAAIDELSSKLVDSDTGSTTRH